VTKRCLMVAAASLVVVFTSGSSLAKDDSSVDRDIYELLDVTGAFNVAQQVMRGMAQARPGIPKEFWDDMMGRIKKEDFYVLLAAVYRRNMSPEDIKALLAFYRTPLGQRVIKALPLITQESMVAGRLWGEKITREISAEAKKRGYKI
jgi:uncharacterized protein